MRLLVDTCTFLWMCSEPAKLSATAAGAVAHLGHEVFLSAVSAVEIAIKHELGQLALPAPPAAWVPASRIQLQLHSLPLDEAAALRLASLPRLHRDPFDRMLICQALEAGLTLVTPDPMIRKYAVPTLW